MPSTPMRCTLPKLSFTSRSVGTAFNVTWVPPRSTPIASGSPALTLIGAVGAAVTAGLPRGGLLAAVLGRPLRISEEPELTALGTARLAAEAAGLAVVLRSEGRLVQPPRDLRPWRARFAAARAAVEAYGMA